MSKRLSEEEKNARKKLKEKTKEELKVQKEIEKKEHLLDSTARFMLNVFNTKSGNYSAEFEKLLLAGGGGNSMFVNCWAKPSIKFVRYRISDKAKKKLAEFGYDSVDDAPSEFKHNNAKGASNRIAAGKHLHLDHNPGNVKVLELIREKCRKYDFDEQDYESVIAELKDFLQNIQTLDWITVEQDDVRTLSDSKHTKKQKDKFTAKQRDDLLKDNFSFLDEK